MVHWLYHCSADLEYLIIKCRPIDLPQQFTCIITVTVYVPPDANGKVVMKDLSAAISKLQTLHQDRAFIVSGDFNHCNLQTMLPRFYQNASYTTSRHTTLDHIYTNAAHTYKATPLRTWDSLIIFHCYCFPSTGWSLNMWNQYTVTRSGWRVLTLTLLFSTNSSTQIEVFLLPMPLSD